MIEKDQHKCYNPTIMESLKISFVCTVFNEGKTIIKFLESIDNQSKLPNEIIIVDAGSSDETVSIINSFKSKKKLNLKVFIKKGNRSVGRNYGVKKSIFNIIVTSLPMFFLYCLKKRVVFWIKIG